MGITIEGFQAREDFVLSLAWSNWYRGDPSRMMVKAHGGGVNPFCTLLVKVKVF